MRLNTIEVFFYPNRTCLGKNENASRPTAGGEHHRKNERKGTK